MRTAILALTTLLMALGIWHFLGDGGPAAVSDIGMEGEASAADPRVAKSDEAVYQPGVMPVSGTLRVKVTSKSGHIPAQAKAGYIFGGRARLRSVNELGLVIFTDAPLGRLKVVGQAPGFLDGSMPCFLNAGVPESVILTLALDKDKKVLVEPPPKR